MVFTVGVRAQPPPPPRWADAGLVSGEAVELDVRAARLGSRVLALLIDAVIQLALALVLGAVLGMVALALLGDYLDAALAGALQIVLLVLVLIGYPVVMERFAGGRTVGKLAVGLRVVRAAGRPSREHGGT